MNMERMSLPPTAVCMYTLVAATMLAASIESRSVWAEQAMTTACTYLGLAG